MAFMVVVVFVVTMVVVLSEAPLVVVVEFKVPERGEDYNASIGDSGVGKAECAGDDGDSDVGWRAAAYYGAGWC